MSINSTKPTYSYSQSLSSGKSSTTYLNKQESHLLDSESDSLASSPTQRPLDSPNYSDDDDKIYKLSPKKNFEPPVKKPALTDKRRMSLASNTISVNPINLFSREIPFRDQNMFFIGSFDPKKHSYSQSQKNISLMGTSPKMSPMPFSPNNEQTSHNTSAHNSFPIDENISIEPFYTSVFDNANTDYQELHLFSRNKQGEIKIDHSKTQVTSNIIKDEQRYNILLKRIDFLRSPQNSDDYWTVNGEVGH